MSRFKAGFGRMASGGGRHIVGDAATAALNSAFARMHAPGRDGTLVCTRAGSMVNPYDGSLVGADTPVIAPISLAGRVLNAYGSFRSRTNLVTAQSVGGGIWYTSGGSPTVTTLAGPVSGVANGYNVAGGNRGYGFGAISGTYTLSAWVRNTGKSLRFRRGSGAFNLFGKIDGGSTWQHLSVVVAPDGASSFELYVDDGLDVAGVQLEAAGYASPYIPTAGSAVTCPADKLLWTDPVGWSNGAPGELVLIECPCYWSAAIGAAHPSGASARLIDLGTTTTDGLNRSSSNGKDSFFGTGSVSSAASAAESSGALRMVSAAWNGTTATIYQGVTAGTPGAFTLNAQTWAFLGNTSLLTSAWDGFTLTLFFPGGLTTAERAALFAAVPSTLALAA